MPAEGKEEGSRSLITTVKQVFVVKYGQLIKKTITFMNLILFSIIFQSNLLVYLIISKKFHYNYLQQKGLSFKQLITI